MWDGLDSQATEQALAERARNPTPPAPARVSGWAQTGELLAAPFKGIGQGVLQTARNVNTAAGVSGVSAIDPREDLEGYREEQALSREGAALADPLLRRGVDSLKPDAQASTTASLILQDAARVLTKVGGYALVGGAPGAVVGTGVDESLTGYAELRDKGVDPATAAKVAAVRGAATAVGIAAPVAGRTLLQSAGIVAATGPGTFIAEQTLTRDILERANYPELAAEHDPFDPVGLAVSTLVPAVFGGAVHLGRARRSRQPGAQPDPVATLADTPEVVDAAHVAYRQQTVETAMLGDRADPQTRATHAQALDDAVRAMDEGEPVRVAALEVDPAKAQRVVDEVSARLRAVDSELAALRTAETLPEAQPSAFDAATTTPEPAPGPLRGLVEQLQQLVGIDPRARPTDSPPSEGSPTMQRASRIAAERPALPVRLDDGEPPASAADLVASVRDEATRNRTDRRAFEAAVECAIRHGE